jgi:hypothetical protein
LQLLHNPSRTTEGLQVSQPFRGGVYAFAGGCVQQQMGLIAILGHAISSQI